jgi:outer membrane receptor protein involved in Fe transport
VPSEPLSAQDNGRDPAPETDRPLETVVVTATRRELPRSQVAGAINLVDEARIRRNAPQVIAGILRGTPGSFFQQTTPGQGIPIVRGLIGSQVLHLVDGIRVNNAFFRDAPNQYLGLIDPALVQRVEVLRGSAGSLYGADAMGGVVQLLTTEVRFEGDEVQRSGRAYGSFDSGDRGTFLRAEAATGNARGSIAGGVSWQKRHDRRIGGGEVIAPSGFESQAANARLLIQAGDYGEWMLSGQTLEQPSTPRVGELVPGFGQTTPAASQYRYEPNRRSLLHARYRNTNPQAWLDAVEVNLAQQVIVDDRIIQDYDSPIVSTEQNRSTLNGLTLQAVRESSGGLDLVGGLEIYRDSVRSTRQDRLSNDGPGVPVAPRFPNGSSMDSDAAYLNLSWTRGRWGVDTGLRYSRFNVWLPGSTVAPPLDLDLDDVTGELRLRYQLTPGIQLLSNLGRGFRPPNIFDLGAFGPRPGNRFNVANTELDSESVWSLDLGLRANGDQWQLETFLFVLDYRDRITSVETGDITPGGRIVVRSENRDRVWIQGLELAGSWRPLERLEIDGALNITWGEEQDDLGIRTPASRIPPVNGRLGMTWQAAERWQIIPFLLFAARQDRLSPRDELDPRIDPSGTPGWLTVNFHVQWQVTQPLALGLRLNNLFDRDYREHGSGINAVGFDAGLWANLVF